MAAGFAAAGLGVAAGAAPPDGEPGAGGVLAADGEEGSPVFALAGAAVTMFKVVLVPAGCEIDIVALPVPVDEALVEAEPLAGAPAGPPPPVAPPAGAAAALVALPPAADGEPEPGEDGAEGAAEGGDEGDVGGAPGAFVPARALLTSVA